MADIGIVPNTTTHLIPEKGQPHCTNDNLMLLVQHLHDDGTLDCSLISTQINDFKVLRQDDDEILNLLKEDDYDPTFCTLYSVCATCNSWMLLSCNQDPPFDFLWNPTTGERIALPYFALASPTLSDYWAYGLMVDPAGEQWKVLRSRVMNKYSADEEIYAELLSSASDSWKRIPCYVYISPCQQPSLYINGFYYWPTDVGGILRFDFTEEKFGALIPEPKSDKFPGAAVSTDSACLVEYDESLASVVFKRGDWLKKMEVTSIPASAERKPFVFEIWVWKEAATWSCVFTGEIPVLDASVKRVLGLYKKRNLLLERSSGDLFVYDIQTKALENLGIRGGRMRLTAFPYVANAEPSHKSSWKNRSSGFTCTVDGVPATIGACTRALKANDYGVLMLMVQCVLDWTRIYFEMSIISTENNSFKVLLQDVDDSDLLRNLSRLIPENYDIDCMNAKYHVLASCNTWMLWEYTEIPLDPEVLLWDPRENVLVKLPSFRAKPRVPHPTFECMWAYGIGFDPCAPVDYKVVRCRVFEYFRSNGEAHAELFSFGTWKEILYPHDPQWEVFQDPSLFIDGFYYWTAEHSTNEELAIISFDFAKEEFTPTLIPMPCSEIVSDITRDCVCIAEFHGLLAAIVFVNPGQEKSTNINCPRQKQQNKKQTKLMKTEEYRAPNCIFEILVWENGMWYHVSTHKVRHPNPAVSMRVVGFYKNEKVFLQDSEGYLCVYSREMRPPRLVNVGIRDDTFSLKIFPYV